jgi:hypothetical protein
MTARRLALAATLIALIVAASNASAQSLLSGTSSPLLLPQQSIPWTPPPAQQLRCGPICSASEGGTTATEQGAGSTCSNAVTALNAELHQIAAAFCMNNTGFPACNVVFTYTIGCTETGGAWNVSGFATFSCRDTTC